MLFKAEAGTKGVIAVSMSSLEASLNPGGQGLAKTGLCSHLEFECLSLGSGYGRWSLTQHLPKPQEALAIAGGIRKAGQSASSPKLEFQLGCPLASLEASLPRWRLMVNSRVAINLHTTESQERACHDTISPISGVLGTSIKSLKEKNNSAIRL